MSTNSVKRTDGPPCNFPTDDISGESGPREGRTVPDCCRFAGLGGPGGRQAARPVRRPHQEPRLQEDSQGAPHERPVRAQALQGDSSALRPIWVDFDLGVARPLLPYSYQGQRMEELKSKSTQPNPTQVSEQVNNPVLM